jgi:hypothetical protein
MGDINLNEPDNANENKWADNISSVTDMVPKPLQYILVFASAAFIGSAAAYYINPTGLLCGVLAVLIYCRAK